MKLIDSEELLKWIDESLYHYEAIIQLGKMLPSDRCYMDAFKSLKDKILSMQPASQKMSVEEAKEAIAKKEGVSTWDILVEVVCSDMDGIHVQEKLEPFINEAIALYAQQFNPNQ